MGRGKKKGGRRRGDDSEEEQEQQQQQEQQAAANVPEQQGKKQSRKQKRQQKQQQKKQESSDDSDIGNDDLAALISGKITTTYGSDSESDSDHDDVAVAPPPAASKARGNKNKKKKASAVLAAAFESSDEESDQQEEEEDTSKVEDDDDVGEVQQVAVTLADDDDWGLSSKKKKKEKKEKKEKRHKKEKKKKKDKSEDGEKKKKKDKKEEKKPKDDDDGTGSHDSSKEEGEEVMQIEQVSAAVKEMHIQDEEKPKGQPKVESKAEANPADAAAVFHSKKKSKFELQMEEALKKKEAEKHKKTADTEIPSETPAETAKEPEPEPDWIVETKKPAEPNVIQEDHEIMYGHGDDVWNDASHAMREAEANRGKDDKDSLYGPDGKKLSNKERKKLQKARAAAEREAEYEASAAKASREGAQFACSQTAVDERDPQWQNSLDIKIPSFSISAAGKILFKDASLTIGHGRRYGLVGPNGKGKSTLLKMIHSGDLKLPPRIDFLYVEQEVVADDTPAVEAVLKADMKRWNLLEEEKKLMVELDAGDESEEKLVRLQQIVDELTAMGADAAEAKARRILYGLGFSMEMQTKPTKMFSGGWRMRISLARALFIEPTLLALDEPTNHLDLNAVIWLDEYLQKWKKTLLVVSHDQDFLNSVCQEILHIEDLKLISYKGNYDSFKKAEATKFQQQVKAWEKQEKRLRELKRSGQSKAKAQETVKKNSKREAGARSQKKKNDAVAAGTETAEQAELIKRPKEYHVKLHFPEVNELSRPVIEVNNVHFRYSPKHPVIFDCIDFGIDLDSRVTIVGPNGAGKSTLLKLLTGEVDATKGEVRRNPRLRMGIYNQHFVDRLPMGKSPVEYLRDRYQDEDYQSIRNRLGKYGLEGHAHEVTMRDLSGGQKARVVFVDLSLQCPHVLLLDEPTNNLDIETIDALCDAINEFNGGVVVVTHDQRLIEECDCTLWVVEKQGVTRWEEGFDDYKETILRELEEQVEKEAAIRREKVEAAAAARAEKLARLATKLKKK